MAYAEQYTLLAGTDPEHPLGTCFNHHGLAGVYVVIAAAVAALTLFPLLCSLPQAVPLCTALVRNPPLAAAPDVVCGPNWLNLCAQLTSDACQQCRRTADSLMRRVASLPPSDCRIPGFPPPVRFWTCTSLFSRLVQGSAALGNGTQQLLQMFQGTGNFTTTDFCQAVSAVDSPGG